MRRILRRKLHQAARLSRKSVELGVLLGGAALVSLVSLGFAQLADLALEWNAAWIARSGWLAFILLPFGLAAIRWLTLRLAPNASGSGIPQVIGALSLPPRPQPVQPGVAAADGVEDPAYLSRPAGRRLHRA